MKKIAAASRTREVRHAIREVEARALELMRSGRKVFRFNIGDPNKFDFDTPEHVRSAACDAINNHYNCYPNADGDPELIEAIKKNAAQKGVAVQDAVVTAGVSEGIVFLFSALLDHKNKVLIPAPAYPQYPSTIKFLGGEPVFYPCREEDAWQPDFDAVRKQVDSRTKALCLINPNNPTGAVYEKKVLKQAVDFAGEHGLTLVSDEIYHGLVFDKQFIPLASLSKDVPVITFNGIAKVCLAPGWRIGWMAFSDQAGVLDDVREAVHKLCRLRLCTTNPFQRGALAALNGSQDFLKETVRKLKERRDVVAKRCAEIPGLSLSKPEGAFYAFPRVEGPWKTDEEFVRALLNETGVCVVHGSGFSSPGKHFRTVILPQPAVLNEAFDLVEAFMKKHAGKT